MDFKLLKSSSNLAFMNRFLYPYITGLDGKRYKCQFRYKRLNENNETLYQFLEESSGDTYTIKKVDDKWVFDNGGSYLNHWVEELGRYVDESGI